MDSLSHHHYRHLTEVTEWSISHITVTGGNKAGVDHVLIQPYTTLPALLCKSCCSHAV